MAKTISHCQGKGSLTHNNRTFSAKNVDKSRTPDNIIFKQQPIAEAYDFLFSAAVQRYNDKQKRADRKISTSYFEYAFGRKDAPPYVVTAPDKRKSFYEDVVQIGTMNDTGVGSADAAVAAECLKIYAEGFQARNPNFYVFLSTLHNDEATPHLHIDYIPVGHYTRGVDTQNGIAQALKEMGYGTGKDAINRWRLSERAVLEQICREHGIEISAPEKSHGSLLVEEYKEYAKIKEQADEKQQEVQQLDTEISDKEKQHKHLESEIASKEWILEQRDFLLKSAEETIYKLDEQYREKDAAVERLNAELKEKSAAVTAADSELSARNDLLEKCAGTVSKIRNVDSIETKSALGGRVAVSREDFTKLTDLAKKGIANENKVNDLNSENIKLRGDTIALRKEIQALQPFKSAYSKLKRDFDNFQAKYQKIVDFVESIGFTQKLNEYLQPTKNYINRR